MVPRQMDSRLGSPSRNQPRPHMTKVSRFELGLIVAILKLTFLEANMPLRNVAVLGANGRLGQPLLRSLIKSQLFNVTVLLRQTSSTSFASNITTLRIPDDDKATEAQLGCLLTGQHALIVAIPAKNSSIQICLARACVQAGVQRFIPADFGSIDSLDPENTRLLPVYEQKNIVRNELDELAQRSPNFSWTSIVCGHFFDWGLSTGFLGFDLTAFQADVLDDGTARWSTSTLSRVGAVVVAALTNDYARNRRVFVQSFCVSQNEILKSLERASGRTWDVRHIDSAEALQREKQKMDEGDPEAWEQVAAILGMTRSNWEDRLANGALDLEPESLDDVVSEVFSLHSLNASGKRH